MSSHSEGDKRFTPKQHSMLVDGSSYQLGKAGVIQIQRHFENPVLPYAPEDVPDYLAAVEHSFAIADKPEYQEMLAAEQAKFNDLARKLKKHNQSLIIALQGRDGAGKGGTSKKIEKALGNDFKIFDSVPVGPPTEEERSHPHLWRYYRHDRMPGFGQVRVFDRTWAERVLVEKVRKLAPEQDIQDSYAQIRMFEWLLVDQRAIVIKIWLDITRECQDRRFETRRKHKPWKVSEFDMIAREDWDKYTPAANELFHRTGTTYAPWYIISSEDKRFARVAALKLINRVLEKRLGKHVRAVDLGVTK